MDGIADVTQRIADIQSKLTSLRPAPVPFADLLQSSSSTATAASTTTDAGTPLGPSTWAAATSRPAWATTSAQTAATGTAAATTTATSPSEAAAPVKTNGKVTVPEELRRFGNGKIPAGELAPIGQGSHRLAGKAAAAWQRMEAAAAADGITLKVTDSYRDYDTQVDLVRRKGLYSQGGLAAKPGTSNHGWGLAVDLSLNAKQQAWMRENGARFGFVEDTPREPWHWGFHG